MASVRQQTALLLIVLASLGSARAAVAQVVPHPDSAQLAAAAAHAALLHWVASSSGASEQSVYLRNTSTRPVQVTSYEIYECINLAKSVCGVHRPGPFIKPGATVVLQIIRQPDRRQSWSHQYRFDALFAPPDSTGP
jgi:hypothetical protein